MIRNNKLLEKKEKKRVRKEKEKDIRIQFNNDKQVEYYSGQVVAWFNTKLERDKSILTLSTGAIGLLITLASAVDIKNNYVGYSLLIVLYIAMIFYLIAIIYLLKIFFYNAKHIQADIMNNEEQIKQSTQKLKNLDKKSSYSFAIGIIFSIIFSGIFIYNKNYKTEEVKMSEKELKVSDLNNSSVCHESYDEMQNIKPASTDSTMYMKKSYDEMSQIKPVDSDSSKDNNSSSN